MRMKSWLSDTAAAGAAAVVSSHRFPQLAEHYKGRSIRLAA